MRIRVLHTNDIHSRFENFAQIVNKIQELRNENTLTLDAGDFNDFMRIELQGTDGKAGIDILESARYDAIAVGNNETFQGLHMLESMAGDGRVPFLSCNLVKLDKSSINGIKKSIIIEKNGIKFLIIGISPNLEIFFTLAGMAAVDYKDEIRKEIDRSTGKYDICILLSHLGLNRDRDIAETIDGIDIIIGGHSHDLMAEPELVGHTIIHQSGCFGENLGVLDFEYNGKITAFEGYNIKSEGLLPDIKTLKILEINKELAIDNLAKPLYYLENDLWHDIVEENPMTNLLADALRDVLKSDIGIINSGVLSGGIKKGPVSLKKLLEICPSPLNPTYMEVKGKDIRDALNLSMYADVCLRDGRGAGYRGKYLGRLHVSGMTVYHDGRHIKEIIIGNKPLRDSSWYTVATSDYLQRGTGYPTLSNNINPRYNPEYLRDTLKDYISREDFVKNSLTERWINK